MKKMHRQVFISILTLTLVLAFSAFVAAADIQLGGIMDTTGATSDVGKDYAIGMEEAIKYINDQGGVNGKKIKYTWFDYGYRIPEAITKYNLLKRLGVVVDHGVGHRRHRGPLSHGEQGPDALCLRFLLGSPDRSEEDALQPVLLFGLLHQCQGLSHRLV